MGWLYTEGQSRSELIQSLIKRQENDAAVWDCLKHAANGNNLWCVFEVTRKDGEGQVTGLCPRQRYIILFKLQGQRGYGWGYKDIEECMGPYEHDCPLSFLDLVPEPKRPEGYHDWRQGVRDYHARRNQKLRIGQEVRLTNGQTFTITSLKPLLARDKNLRQWRIPRRMLTLPAIEAT